MPSIVDLGYQDNIRVAPEITEDIPLSSVNQEIPNKAIDLSKMTIDTFQVNQHIRGGADGYNDGVGWWIGRDIDGVAKLFFGNSAGDKVIWDGSTLTITGDLVAGELHIPDKTTADSFHVNTNGDAWWGCNEADFNSDPDNAVAYILKDGTTKFSTLTVSETGMTLEDIYGDGSDGDVTLTGTTTLTRDMFYEDLDLDGNTLNTAGYRVFVSGTLSGAGIVQNNGNAGGDGASAVDAVPPAGSAGGAGGSAGTGGSGNSVPAGVAGKVGGAGANGRVTSGAGNTGTAGTAGGSTNRTIVSTTGATGGTGGTPTGGVGGAGGAGGTTGTAILNKVRNVMSAYLLSDLIGGVNNFNPSNTTGGSGGGGSGGGSTTPCYSGAGGGGGGSGGAGGIVWIAARKITSTATFKSNGGVGGNGGNGSNGVSVGISGGGAGGAAGSGGNGGSIIIITSTVTPTYSTDVTGGVAGSVGTGGNGYGGGGSGASGGAGNTGTSGSVITLTV